MAEKHVVSALKRKYADLKGELAHYAAPDPEATMNAISAVGFVLHMFSPGEDLSAIKPIRPSVTHGRHWTRTALRILRREQRPMTARELARVIIAEKGRDLTALSSVECALHVTLAGLEGRHLRRVSEGPKAWRMNPAGGSRQPPPAP